MIFFLALDVDWIPARTVFFFKGFCWHSAAIVLEAFHGFQAIPSEWRKAIWSCLQYEEFVTSQRGLLLWPLSLSRSCFPRFPKLRSYVEITSFVFLLWFFQISWFHLAISILKPCDLCMILAYEGRVVALLYSRHPLLGSWKAFITHSVLWFPCFKDESVVTQ